MHGSPSTCACVRDVAAKDLVVDDLLGSVGVAAVRCHGVAPDELRRAKTSAGHERRIERRRSEAECRGPAVAS